MSAACAIVRTEKERARDRRRNGRPREARALTVGVRASRAMARAALDIGRDLFPEQPGVDYRRPRTRGDCANGPRPCPYASCRHHLFVDTNRAGGLKLNFPDLDLAEMSDTCALDVADRGGASLEDVGALMNVTREAVRLIELRALRKVAAESASALRPFAEDE